MPDNYADRSMFSDQFESRPSDLLRERGSIAGKRENPGSYQVERGLQEHTFPPNRRMPTGSGEASNMDDLQRWVSGVGGAALLWYGFQQRGLSRWSLAALGTGLLYQGIAGDNLLDHLPVAQQIPIVREMTSAPTQLRVRKSVTINKPVAELYNYWRNLENLPHFMSHVKSVREVDENRSHWVVQVLNDMELEWDAQITVDRPNEMIAWETLPEADIANRGYVKFIPTARGTEISVSMEYDPPSPAGRLAGRAVKFIAEQQVKEDIRRFKRLMETGEIPTVEGQPAARGSMRGQQRHHAQGQSGVAMQSLSSIPSPATVNIE